MKKSVFLVALIAAAVINTMTAPCVAVAAGESENTAELDVSKGVIDIYPEGYSQTQMKLTGYMAWEVAERLTEGDASGDYDNSNRPEKWQVFQGTYIIKGKSYEENTALDIMNFSGKPVVYNLIFEDLTIKSYDWCTAIRFKGNAPITVNIINKGTTAIEGDNHPAFKINGNEMNGSNVYVNVYNTLGAKITFADNQGPEREQIYNVDEEHTESRIIFTINQKVVDDGNDGTIPNTGESFNNTHGYHNFKIKESESAQINATWEPAGITMTHSEFDNNTKNVTCTFTCTECNEKMVVEPTRASISEDGTKGTYYAVLAAEEAKCEDGKAVESEMTYKLQEAPSGGTDDEEQDKTTETDSEKDKVDTTNTDKVPQTGDAGNVTMWTIVMFAAIAVCAGFKKKNVK